MPPAPKLPPDMRKDQKSNLPKVIMRLPAGILPKTEGLLLHLNLLFSPQCLQVWTTMAMVPFLWMSTVGLSDLHLKQNMMNRDINIPKNTMNFGSSTCLVSE